MIKELYYKLGICDCEGTEPLQRFYVQKGLDNHEDQENCGTGIGGST